MTINTDIDSILGTLDTYLRWNRDKDSHKRTYEICHPSSFGKCLRLAQYQRYGDIGLIEKPSSGIDSRVLRLFDTGHSMHERFASYFANLGVLRGIWECTNPFCGFYNDKGEHSPHDIEEAKSNPPPRRKYGNNEKIGVLRPKKCLCGHEKFAYREVNVYSKELNFSGHVDSILDYSQFDSDIFNGTKKAFNSNRIPDHPVIVDYKTIASFGWRKIDRSGPSREYVVQLTIYNNLLDIPFGILLYENKDTSEIRCYKVEKNEHLFELLCSQSKLMNEMVETKRLPPPKPKQKKSTECRYCDYSGICHKSNVWNNPKLDIMRNAFYGETEDCLDDIFAKNYRD